VPLTVRGEISQARLGWMGPCEKHSPGPEKPSAIAVAPTNSCSSTRTATKRFSTRFPIHQSNFNKTFFDSFQIARDLGYSYIWIDLVMNLARFVRRLDRSMPSDGRHLCHSNLDLSVTGMSSGEHGIIIPSEAPGYGRYFQIGMLEENGDALSLLRQPNRSDL